MFNNIFSRSMKVRKFCTGSHWRQSFSHEKRLDVLLSSMREPQGYHSSDKNRCKILDILRDVLEELSHFHHHNYFHGHISTRSIVIMEGSRSSGRLVCPSIYGNMGAQNIHGCAEDMVDFGRTLFYSLTKTVYKDQSQLSKLDRNAEAKHLLQLVLQKNPTDRPTAKMLLNHPLFWTRHVKLLFIRDVYELLRRKILRNDRSLNRSAYLKVGREILRSTPWDASVDLKVMCAVSKSRRKYNSREFFDLLAFVQNVDAHFNDLPKSIQRILGKKREILYAYFSNCFPRLFMKLYSYAKAELSKESVMEPYM